MPQRSLKEYRVLARAAPRFSFPERKKSSIDQLVSLRSSLDETEPVTRYLSRPETDYSSKLFSHSSSERLYRHRIGGEDEDIADIKMLLKSVDRGAASFEEKRPTLGLVMPKLETKSPSADFLERIDRITREQLKKHLGRKYREAYYFSDKLEKIKHTLIDLTWSANTYNLDKNDFSNFLTFVRLINEIIYHSDSYVENMKNGSGSKADTFTYPLIMMGVTDIFLGSINKPKMIPSVKDIVYATNSSFLKEIVDHNSEDADLIDDIAEVYGNSFEPSAKPFIDTGGYGTVLGEYFELDDRDSFNQIWNNSRRATDIIDCVLDLKEDVASNSAPPFIGYVLFHAKKCKPEDVEILERSFGSRTYSKEVEKVVHKYSSEALNNIRKYVQSISPKSGNVMSLKQRSLKIIDLGLQLAKGVKTEKGYEDFYTNTLESLDYFS